jgi:class 3 adenylate cyclase
VCPIDEETEPSVRKTLALLVCDVVNATGLIAREGDLIALALFRDFFENAGRLGQEHHCLLIKFVGDAFLAAFENMADTLPFVFAIQNLLSELVTFKGRQLAFRFSLHFGDVLYVETSYGKDVLGAEVNVVAHLNDLAQPDQIVISQAAMQRMPREQQSSIGLPEHCHVKGTGEVEFSRLSLITS